MIKVTWTDEEEKVQVLSYNLGTWTGGPKGLAVVLNDPEQFVDFMGGRMSYYDTDWVLAKTVADKLKAAIDPPEAPIVEAGQPFERGGQF